VSVFNVGETFGLSSLGTLSPLLKLGGQVEQLTPSSSLTALSLELAQQLGPVNARQPNAHQGSGAARWFDRCREEAIEGTIFGFRQDYGRHQVIKRQAGKLDHS